MLLLISLDVRSLHYCAPYTPSLLISKTGSLMLKCSSVILFHFIGRYQEVLIDLMVSQWEPGLYSSFHLRFKFLSFSYSGNEDCILSLLIPVQILFFFSYFTHSGMKFSLFFLWGKEVCILLVVGC